VSGETKKNFHISLILATIRAQIVYNSIALAIVSHGIAGILLNCCRTALSALKSQLNIHIFETPTCNINKTSGIEKLLKSC